MSKHVSELTRYIADNFRCFIPNEPECFTKDLFEKVKEYREQKEKDPWLYRDIQLDMYLQISCLRKNRRAFALYKAHFESFMNNIGVMDACRKNAHALILELSKDCADKNSKIDGFSHDEIKRDMLKLSESLNAVKPEDILIQYRNINVEEFTSKFHRNWSQIVFNELYRKAKQAGILSNSTCCFYESVYT